MRHDLSIYKRLEKAFPGAMIMVRYEDYITNVNETLNKMYSHLDEVAPPSIYSRLMSLMHSEHEGQGFHQNRQNATDSLYKWIKKNTKEQIEAMTLTCKDVLVELGYPLDVRKL